MTETKNEIRVAKNHKDRLFRMIFREKKELLSLIMRLTEHFTRMQKI